MPRIPLNRFKPKTPIARLRREFLFHKAGNPFHKAERRFYQQDLADDLDVTVARIQQLELGTEPLPKKHALKCQEIYGISADWLLKVNPRARPVTPDGNPYSKAIAANSRRNYRFRLSKKGNAGVAWHLARSLEALLSEIRTAIIRTNQKEGPTAAASLFSDVRDAVAPALKAADPATSVDSRLQAEAERLLVSRDKYERHRLDLTQQCLGVDDYPIIGPDGKEVEFQPVSPKDKTIKWPDAQIIGKDGQVIEVRPITHEEAIKFQPGPLKESTRRVIPKEELQRREKSKADAERIFRDKMRTIQPASIQEANMKRHKEIIRKACKSGDPVEMQLLELRVDYHLMDSDEEWEQWKPKLMKFIG
jgi:transcriptional regulator with XRE-family HTH domain